MLQSCTSPNQEKSADSCPEKQDRLYFDALSKCYSDIALKSDLDIDEIFRKTPFQKALICKNYLPKNRRYPPSKPKVSLLGFIEWISYSQTLIDIPLEQSSEQTFREESLMDLLN